MTSGDAPIDEDARRRFEADRVAGGVDPIDAFLPDASAPTFAATLEELVAIDIEFRWKRWAQGGAVAADAPDLAAYEALLARVPDADVRARLDREQARLRKRFAPRFQAREGVRLAHYALRECVGRGAFAEVWRAFDERLRRDVAVKLARPELADDPQIVARLLREAQSAARLRHPGIVPVHEVGEREGRPYIVSDFVEGGTLAEAMRARRFDPDESARIVLDLAEALDYAHAFGVVHRDVKPGNVLVGEDGRPLLADFGLAQLHAAETSLTRHGEVVGTPAYMSPEQARGEPRDADARSDVYSLGVVLYELLTGALPFERSSSEGLLYAVVHEEPPAPRTRVAALPADLDTICMKAMAKEKTRRYATAREFAEDLRRHLERRPILARAVGPWERALLWTRRNPALAATIAAGFAAVLLVGGIGLSRVLEERRRYREERDRANAHLCRSLVTEAQAHVATHDSEWRSSAMDALREAAALDVPTRDVAALRDLVLACETSFYPSFRRIARWPACRGAATTLAAAPAGDVVAAATDEGAVWVRETDGGRVVAAAAVGGAKPRRLAFVDGGMIVVGCDDGGLRLLDAKTLAAVGETASREGDVQALAASPRGDLVAVGRGSGAIDVWRVDAAARRLDRLFDLEGHDGGTVALRFSPDARRLASGGMDRWVRVWDLDERRAATSVRATDAPRSLDFSPSGDKVAWCTWESAGWGLLAFGAPPIVEAWHALHLSAVRDVAFRRDGSLLTSSADGTLRVTTPHRDLIAVARGEAGPVTAAVVVPGTTRILAAHADGAVLAWDLATSPQRETFGTMHVARFVPGTARLVTGSAAYDFGADGRAARRDVPVPHVRAVVAPQNGAVACGRSDGGVLVWTDGAGEPRRLPAGDSPVTCLAATPDGSLYAAGDESGAVRLIRPTSDASIEVVSPALGEARAVALSQDGALAVVAERGVALRRADGVVVVLSKARRDAGAAAFAGATLAATGADGRIELFDARDASLVRALEGHASPVTALAFADGGRRLVSAARDQSFRVWDVASGAARSAPIEGAGPAAWLAVDPRSELVARGGAGWADVIDIASLAVVARLDAASSTSGAFGADGALHVGLREGAVFTWARASIDAARAAAASEPPTVPADRVLLAGAHRSQIWGVAASPDGRRVATTSHEGEVKLWDAASLALVRDLRPAGGLSWCAAFSPDSRVVAAGVDESVVLIDAADGRETARLDGHEGLVTGVAFHPTRPILATASSDRTVRLWDARDGRALGVLHRAASALHDLTFSPDGATLAVACSDGNALLWDDVAGAPKTRAPDRILDCGGGPAWAVAFDSKRRFFATGTERGVVTLRDARTSAVLARFAGDQRLVRSLSFDDTGRFLAAGCYGGESVAMDLPALRAVLSGMGLDW